MLADYATFAALYPELLTTINAAAVNLRLQENAADLSQGSWGRCWAQAVLEMTAHETALANARAASVGAGGVVSASGVLQSGSEEGIAFAFADTGLANKSANAQWLAQTPYGQAFSALAKRCLAKSYLSW